MAMTNYLYGEHFKDFCTTSFHGHVATSFAFSFH